MERRENLGRWRRGEAADADFVADVMVRAAQSPQAANKAFNITNGDVFEWRYLLPGLAETLGVETGPDMPTRVAAYLEENADVWDQIVAKYDLRTRTSRSPTAPRKDLEPS